MITQNTVVGEGDETKRKLKHFYLRKITGLSTLEREYRALHKFHDLSLKNMILSIEAHPKMHSYFTIPYQLD